MGGAGPGTCRVLHGERRRVQLLRGYAAIASRTVRRARSLRGLFALAHEMAGRTDVMRSPGVVRREHDGARTFASSCARIMPWSTVDATGRGGRCRRRPRNGADHRVKRPGGEIAGQQRVSGARRVEDGDLRIADRCGSPSARSDLRMPAHLDECVASTGHLVLRWWAPWTGKCVQRGPMTASRAPRSAIAGHVGGLARVCT